MWTFSSSDGLFVPVSPPGVIGGAVIEAARQSAGLPRVRLAHMLDVSPATVHAWEKGTAPLFCVPYGQLCAVADALELADAQVGHELGELLLASQCDLLVTSMLCGFEDYAEAPPIDDENEEGEAARSLVRWAMTGVVPERYRPHGSAHPLLARPDVTRLTQLAEDLQAGAPRVDLTGYGAALTVLALPNDDR